MDHSKIEMITGLQRKIDYDLDFDQVVEEDIDHMVELYDSLTEEEESELWKNL